MKVLALLLLGLLAVGFAHKHHHSHHDEHNYKHWKHHHPTCHYTATNGGEYDLRLLNKSYDYSFSDSFRRTFYFQPCGTLKNNGECDPASPVCLIEANGIVVKGACDPKAAVCMIESNGKTTNFGSAGNTQWADGVQGATVEATYGEGETCPDGIPRKTVVEYVCSVHVQASGSKKGPESRIASVEYSPCFLKMIMHSPHACPTSLYCGTLKDETTCEDTKKLCKWKHDECIPHGSHHDKDDDDTPRHSDIVITLIVIKIVLVLFVALGCCFVAVRRKVKVHEELLEEEEEEMKVARGERSESEQLQMEQEQPEEQQGSAPQYQPIPIFYPGQQIPMSPYSMQGYPVMQFVIPSPQPKTEETA